ncbi:MAG TPA: phage major capsid protein [Lachnospiraceae bacterium]|nr:phage major capsid protein [Lachnospiraceae bacterium]
MEIKDMQMADIEARSAELETEMNAENADIEKIAAEATALEERKAQIVAEAEERKAVLEEVEKTAVEIPQERKENMEKENRTEMIEALAEYIKGRATSEQRAMLLTTNASGTVKVSDIVDDYIWTDWNQSNILSRIRKVYVKGNYSVGYEAAATGAVKHTEGAAAPTEETLTLAYVDFIAEYYKKWIRVSDTVLALKGQAFMDYLLKEFGHQLAVALENAVVAEIAGSDLAAKVTNPIDNTAAMAGFAALSDEATNPVVIISKANYAAIMNARATTGAKIEDPFNGMEVLFNNTVTGMLVGDLDGVVANFPEGEDFKFIVDETSLAEQDLVKIVGKVLASIHLVRPNGFAVVTAA